MPKEKSCGALVFHRQGGKLKILILKHRLGGHWSFPKGHVEEGESERETALREIFEETGLSVRILQDFHEKISYSPKPGIDKDVVYFIAYAEDDHTTMQEEEVGAIRWIDLSEAHEFLTYHNDKLLLRRAKRYIDKYGIPG